MNEFCTEFISDIKNLLLNRIIIYNKLKHSYQFICKKHYEIEVSTHWPLAYEAGKWTARRGNVNGPVIISGRYAAQWVKRAESWLIRSEVFVALTCNEDGCTVLSLP